MSEQEQAAAVVEAKEEQKVELSPEQEALKAYQAQLNEAIKALINVVFDGIDLTQDLIAKKNFFSLLPKVFQILAGDVPAAIAAFPNLFDELKKLAEPGMEPENDLVAFIEAKFAGQVSSAKAQAILSAVLKLIVDLANDALALVAALKS